MSRAASWRGRALALGTGVAAALAHPPFGLIALLLAYGLLMHRLDATAAKPRPLRSAFLTGWLAGLGYFLVGVWWVVEAFMVDAASQGWMAPIALALLAGYLSLWWGLAAVAYRRLAPTGPSRVLVFAGAMTGAEWLRGHVLTGFPWNLPGESWVAGSAPSQAAAVLGVYGLTWLTVAMAAALTVVLEGRLGRTYARVAVAALVLLYAAGLARLAAPAPEPAELNVRLVQANVPQALKYSPDAYADIVRRYAALTAQPPAAGAAAPQVVIWPEGAIPDAFDTYMAPEAPERALFERATAPGQILMVGGYRMQPRDGRWAYYNSLFVLRRGPDGLVTEAVYDKHRLVPGGEYLPFDDLLAALGVKKLVNVGDGFSAGPPPAPLSAPGLGRFQPLICYESLFPGFTRAGAATGVGVRPSWIVNISNDAWFGATSGPWQHLNLAAYRAIEEGLPMVRATPTGVSAVIDARGRTIVRLAQERAGVVDAQLPGAERPTLFARLGDAPLGLLLIVSLALTQPVVRCRRALAQRNKSLQIATLFHRRDA